MPELPPCFTARAKNGRVIRFRAWRDDGQPLTQEDVQQIANSFWFRTHPPIEATLITLAWHIRRDPSLAGKVVRDFMADNLHGMKNMPLHVTYEDRRGRWQHCQAYERSVTGLIDD